MNIFINLYDNSSIDCNKNKIYDLYNNIVLNKFTNTLKLLLIHVRLSVVLDN